jgi:hypothetical protein
MQALAGELRDHARILIVAAIFVGLRRALRLWLRVADSLGEHLAKFSLGLCGFPLGWLPLGHKQYVGMLEGKLNPCRDRLHVRCCADMPSRE